MAIQLEIEDGNPAWYLSHDVWTVPGDDPEGSPGGPVVGNNCYLWARVHNNGTTPVSNATVRFYWANPSVGFDRNTANFIGTAFVSLAASEVAEVLCLTPWIPVFVNNGHECILAEAFHPSADPLPASPVFNVPTDRHVAQRNLSVVVAANSMFHMAFEIHNPGRKPRRFEVATQLGKFEELRSLQTVLPDVKPPSKAGKVEFVGFIDKHCPTEAEFKNAKPVVQAIEVAAGSRKGMTLVGKLEGDGALIHVLQKDGEQIIGGLSVLVLSEKAAHACNKGE
jgi:hypothetical protein